MNVKRLILSIIVLAIFISVYNFVFHGLILGNSYVETADSWRPMDEMMSRIWIQYLCFFVIAIGICWLWALAFPGKGIKTGALFGFVLALITAPGLMMNFVHMPTPDRFAVPWLIFGLLGPVLMGILVSLVYKPKATE